MYVRNVNSAFSSNYVPFSMVPLAYAIAQREQANPRKRSKDCKMHNSAPSRDNLRSPSNTKCNTGSLRRALIFLIILQENNTLLDKKLKRLFLQKKSFIFPIENGQQQIYLFLFEYSRRPSWFLFPHTPTGDQSPPLFQLI